MKILPRLKSIYKINERIRNEKNKEIVYTVMELDLEKIGTKITNKIIEKIIEKVSSNMLVVEQMVLEENQMLRNRGKRIDLKEKKYYVHKYAKNGVFNRNSK